MRLRQARYRYPLGAVTIVAVLINLPNAFAVRGILVAAGLFGGLSKLPQITCANSLVSSLKRCGCFE